MSNIKDLLGFNLDRAYTEYKKRIKNRIKYIEQTLGGGMYDGNNLYSKQHFATVVRELMGRKGFDELEPGQAAKLAVNYQAYGDFNTNQANALKRHYEKAYDVKLTTEQARAKSKEISDYYKDLKAKGYTVKEAKKEISWIFFGSK